MVPLAVTRDQGIGSRIRLEVAKNKLEVLDNAVSEMSRTPHVNVDPDDLIIAAEIMRDMDSDVSYLAALGNWFIQNAGKKHRFQVDQESLNREKGLRGYILEVGSIVSTVRAAKASESSEV